MIYSCFNERAGRYEYFQDDAAHPVNGDLPVPQLSSLQAGRVGVPARDAGRPLPSGAKRIGTGWQARGMIVQCKPTSMKGLGQDGAVLATALGRFALVGSGVVLGAWYEHQRDGEPIHGMFAGAIVGVSVMVLYQWLSDQ